MREYEYDKCGYCEKRQEWLKENQNNPITEDEFVSIWQELKKISKSKHLAGLYSPSRLKKQYRNLKEKFGFFPQ